MCFVFVLKYFAGAESARTRTEGRGETEEETGVGGRVDQTRKAGLLSCISNVYEIILYKI